MSAQGDINMRHSFTFLFALVIVAVSHTTGFTIFDYPTQRMERQAGYPKISHPIKLLTLPINLL